MNWSAKSPMLFILLCPILVFTRSIKYYDKQIDKTSSYRKSQNENGNTSKFFVGFHRIKKFSSPKIKIWFEPMFFSGFFCGFHRCGSAAPMTISSFSYELILTHFSKFFNSLFI